jgi:PhnB protein
MFWGDRVAEIEDPSGHRWNLAARKEDLTADEMRARAQAWFASQGKP